MQEQINSNYFLQTAELMQATLTTDVNQPDDELRLIFTCCHPALSIEAQIAPILREICGLTTE